MDLLKMYYFILLNENFFKECMRQYHMMHIRRMRKNRMVKDLDQDAALETWVISF